MVNEKRNFPRGFMFKAEKKKKKKPDSEELKVDGNGNSISSEKDVHAMQIRLACINKKIV